MFHDVMLCEITTRMLHCKTWALCGDLEQVVWTVGGHYSIVFWVADVISIEKTGENFRLIYDVKGRFTVHRITNEEAKVSSLNVLCLGGTKGTWGTFIWKHLLYWKIKNLSLICLAFC